MNKGQRPSKHYRKVKTKHGKRKVLVNKKIRKTSKPKKNVPTIDKTDRKMFNLLSNPNLYGVEYGGFLDFDKKGRLERTEVAKGTEYEIFLDPDWEVLYHTHPDTKNSPPSHTDIMALIQSPKQKAEIIFNNGKAYIIIKTSSTKALSKLPATKLNRQLARVFVSFLGRPNEDKNIKRYLERLGFIVIINNKRRSGLKIDVDPFEPRKKRRKVYGINN